MSLLFNLWRIYQQQSQPVESFRREVEVERAPEEASPEFGAWGYIDALFDYRRIAGKTTVLTREPIPQGAQKRVAIIGAGAGGMCAAFELLKCGIVPTVLEASNRVGGRAWSKHFTESDGQPAKAFAELGAMRVPRAHKTFWKYAEQLGVASTQDAPPFPDPGAVSTLLYYKNEERKWDKDDKLEGIFQKVSDSFTQWFRRVVGDFPVAFKNWQSDPSDENQARLVRLWQSLVNRYKNLSFYDALAQDPSIWTTERLDALGALGVGTGGHGPLYPIGMVNVLRLLLSDWEKEQLLVPKGMEALPRAFYDTEVDCPGIGMTSLKKQDAVKFKHRVASVVYDQHRGKPVVTLEGCAAEEFDAVIVATTSWSMSFMNLTVADRNSPAIISEPVATAIRNLHLTSASKMFIRTKTKFWLDSSGNPKESFPLCVLTDELPRAAYLLNYPGCDNGVVVVSYTWEDDSTRLQALPVERRFEILRDMLYKVAPDWAGHLEPVNNEIINIDWQSEIDYYGAFPLGYPGQDALMHAAYFQFQSVRSSTEDRGVYLAGDCVSWSGGWIEGALQTALNAATAVAERLGGTLQDYNALQQKPDLYNYGTEGAEAKRDVVTEAREQPLAVALTG